MRRFLICMLAAIVILPSTTTSVLASEASNVSAVPFYNEKVSEESLELSPGVTYSKRVYKSTNFNEVIQLLKVDMQDSYTKIELGESQKDNMLETTTKQAITNTYEKHHVVGAINGQFFSYATKRPVSLLAKNNEIINFPIAGLPFDRPTNGPYAFGLNDDGEAFIDKYDLSWSVEISDENTMTGKSMNKSRNEGESVLFTPPYQYTGTNQWGTELVISFNEDIDKIKFNDPIKGRITKISRLGESGNSEIPSNGVVLTVHGKEWSERLKDIRTGFEVEVAFSIDQKWENAQLMLGSGPLLVDNGKIALSMDKNASFAKSRHPRSAVAVDHETGEVYFVTVDGRQSGYSDGLSLTDFADYLIQLGIDDALNLDGGGSTTLAIRKYGNNNVTVANKPSDGHENVISTSLQAISTAPIGPVKVISISKQSNKVLKGSQLPLKINYALDQYYNTVPIDEKSLNWNVTNNIGHIEQKQFVAENAGTGQIIITYEDVKEELPITVLEQIPQLKVNHEKLLIGTSEKLQMQVQGLDESGNAIFYNSDMVNWKVTGDIGTISEEGIFSSGDKQSSGEIIVSIGENKKVIPVKVAPAPVLINAFEDKGIWSSDQARALSQIKVSQANEPIRQGKGSIKLNYDFTTKESGIKAAYAVANTPIAIPGKPYELGIWVFGDGKNHWLRGNIIDANGTQHTINFTKEGELNWTGWKYVTAVIPSDIPLPVKFQRIYVAEPLHEKQGKGVLYFDQLQSVYTKNHVELPFKDVKQDYWAFDSINFLNNSQIITGYFNGTFKPDQVITRADAAIMLARALHLNTKEKSTLPFRDVKENHYAYSFINAVAEKGIITGVTANTYEPNAPLTRAQMAVILSRAYQLTGETEQSFIDISKDFWAKEAINHLLANKLTSGYPDGTYRPEKPISRAEFSAFMKRVIEYKK